tara:strand:+ start:33849 stop:35204 length:1356 start_codon:yes stop_codon:yes gene_type:complete
MTQNKTNTVQNGVGEVPMSSLHRNRNVWYLRFVLMLGVVASVLNGNEYKLTKVPEKVTVWAENWTSINGLDKVNALTTPTNHTTLLAIAENPASKVVKTTEIKNPTNTKTIPSTSSQVAVRMPISVSETPIYVADKNTVTKQNKIAGYLLTSRAHVGRMELVQEPLLVAQRNDEISTERSSELYIKNDYAISRMVRPLYNDEASVSKWSIRALIGPQLVNGAVNQPSGQAYSSIAGIEGLKSQAEGVVTKSTKNSSFSASLNWGVRLSKNFELLSGLNYSQMNGSHLAFYDSELKRSQTILTSRVTTSADGTQNIGTEKVNVVYSNYYQDTLRANYRITSYEIPVTIKYNFGKNKLNYFVSSGVSANIGSSYSATYQSKEIGNGDISQNRYGINSVNLLVGMGLEYKASKNIRIQLSPGFKYGIPLTKSSVFQAPLTAIGLFTGLSYYFDK